MNRKYKNRYFACIHSCIKRCGKMFAYLSQWREISFINRQNIYRERKAIGRMAWKWGMIFVSIKAQANLGHFDLCDLAKLFLFFNLHFPITGCARRVLKNKNTSKTKTKIRSFKVLQITKALKPNWIQNNTLPRSSNSKANSRQWKLRKLMTIHTWLKMAFSTFIAKFIKIYAIYSSKFK